MVTKPTTCSNYSSIGGLFEIRPRRVQTGTAVAVESNIQLQYFCHQMKFNLLGKQDGY